jgi:hypothetical protein
MRYGNDFRGVTRPRPPLLQPDFCWDNVDRVNPRITVRDIAAPLTWRRVRSGMAWHHVIPFSALREVWNRLVEQHINTQIPEARVAIRRYLLLADRNLPHLDCLIDRIRAESNAQRRASHHELQPLDVAEAHRLTTAAVWPPWNTVEGPQRRIDDPHDRYFDRFKSGLTLQEAARMKAIELLFNGFQRFINAGRALGPNNLRALGEAMAGARLIAYCDFPIRYRAELWVGEGGGTWRKRRDGERSTAAIL